MAFQDSFTEASADTDLASHTPTTGTGWTRVTGNSGDVYAAFASDRLSAASTSGAVYICDDQGSANHYAQVLWVSGSSAQNLVLGCRVVDKDNLIGWHMRGTGATGSRLIKRVAGVETDLITHQGVFDGTHTYKIECSGTSIKLYDNGSQVSTTQTVSDHQTETSQGIVSTVAATNAQKFDDFEAGALGGGGATITPTGLASSAFGAFSVRAGKRTITFTGKASDEAFGAFNLRARNLISLTSKTSDEAFGDFNIYPGQVFILPNSKGTDEAFGSSSLLSGQKLISPSGKATDEAFGSFIIVSGDKILLINGVASNEAFGSFSVNGTTNTQNVYPSGYFDSAIGAFSLRPDQYIVFEGQEYGAFGQFLLSGSAVVRAMHFFDWVAQQPGLRGSLNDKLHQYLIAQGFTGSTPTMLFLWLRSLGYVGNTATMLTAFERDYTTRWY